MHDDHPAEQYRAVMAELDAPPPPEPPPAPPEPRPGAVAPPPRTDWLAILRIAGIPAVLTLVALYLLLHALI